MSWISYLTWNQVPIIYLKILEMTLKCFFIAIQNVALLLRSGDQRAHKPKADLFSHERSGNEITWWAGRIFKSRYRSFNFNAKISSRQSIYDQTCKVLSCTTCTNSNANTRTGNKVVRMSQLSQAVVNAFHILAGFILFLKTVYLGRKCKRYYSLYLKFWPSNF